jgi:hypothetical protein
MRGKLFNADCRIVNKNMVGNTKDGLYYYKKKIDILSNSLEIVFKHADIPCGHQTVMPILD